MTLVADVLASWDRDVRAGAQDVFDDYVARVRQAPSTPTDRGRLRDGIEHDGVSGGGGRDPETTVRSTARSDAGADYGTILDTSTGREVRASDYGHRAFGPFQTPVGGTRFLSSFRVTPAPVGWWAESHDPAVWRASGRR